MTISLRFATLTLVTCLLAACASPPSFSPVDQKLLAAERKQMAEMALASWDAERARVYGIRARLWQTATTRGECKKTRPDRGALLESLGDLPSALRDELLNAGSRGDGPYVVAVIPGSPATRAGLQAGDRITGVGRDHVSFHGDVPPGWQDAADVALDVSGPGGVRSISVGSSVLCAVDVVMEETHEISANFDGSRIHVSQGMVQVLPDDASLAFVLAHELGHFTSNHSGLNQILFTSGSRDQEREADLLGIRLVFHAGYRLEQVAGVWDRLAQLDPDQISPAWLADHPTRAERKLRMLAAIAQLRAE